MSSVHEVGAVEEGRCCFCGLQATCGDVDVEAGDGVDVVHGIDGVAVFEARCCGVCGVFGDEFGSVLFAPVLECSFGFGLVHPDEVDDVVVGESLVEW